MSLALATERRRRRGLAMVAMLDVDRSVPTAKEQTMHKRAFVWTAIVGAGLIGIRCADEGAPAPAWIDGFAAGIGKRQAVVVLEPDSLGIIPWSGDWCQPTVTDSAGNTVNAPGADPASRYAQLNYAVDKLAATAPNARVYLDGTHSGWLAVGDAATRLASAGVARAQGFFLNTSNYQITANLA